MQFKADIFYTPFFILEFLLIIVSFSRSKALSLDIHLKLLEESSSSSCLYETSVRANENLRKVSPTEQISFHQTIPHITLYLTNFVDERIEEIVHTLKSIVTCLPQQPIEIDDAIVNGPYAMYQVVNPKSLQSLSDAVVENIRSFITPNQQVPDWVYNLPEPERSRKINYVERYGSPNVFDEFEPHITVGYDDGGDGGFPSPSESERRRILLGTLGENGSCERAILGMVGVGFVGEYGTVVSELIQIPLYTDDGKRGAKCMGKSGNGNVFRNSSSEAQEGGAMSKIAL